MNATLATWTASIAAGLAIAAAGPAMDDEADTALAVAELEQQAGQQLRTELAAARMCRLSHPNSAMVQTAKGEFVCVPRP